MPETRPATASKSPSGCNPIRRVGLSIAAPPGGAWGRLVLASFGKISGSRPTSFPRKRESMWKDKPVEIQWKQLYEGWIPAFAGMTAPQELIRNDATLHFAICLLRFALFAL